MSTILIISIYLIGVVLAYLMVNRITKNSETKPDENETMFNLLFAMLSWYTIIIIFFAVISHGNSDEHDD